VHLRFCSEFWIQSVSAATSQQVLCPGRTNHRSSFLGWSKSAFLGNGLWLMDGLVGDECSGIEIGERLAFYGMSANLVTYLTHVLHEGTAVSAKNVNNWIGTTFLAPLLGAFLADAYWGRFWTIFIFSTVYLVVRNAASSIGIMLERSWRVYIKSGFIFSIWRSEAQISTKLYHSCWGLEE